MVTKIRKILLIAVISIIHAPSIWAQGVIIYKSDGTTEKLSYAAIDSIVTYASYKDWEGSQEEVGTHEAVDLGLSVKWATCNIGATSPEQYGDYFAWGEIEPKNDYSENTYKYYDGSTKEYTYIGSNISGTEYDVAHVKWGNGWRMPTRDEIKELCEKCTYQRSTINGVSGQMIIGANGNRIFLPFTGRYDGRTNYLQDLYGFYWSGTKGGTVESAHLHLLGLDENDLLELAIREVFFGFAVRPVRE